MSTSVVALDREAHRRARRAADPVALHQLDRLGPVERVEIVEQPVGVRGDAQHPLLQRTAVDREVAALAAAVGGDLLVGEHRAEPGTPVDRRVGDRTRAGTSRRAARCSSAPRSSNGTSSGVAKRPARSSCTSVADRRGRGRRPRRTRSCRSAGRSTASSGSTATSVVAGPRRGSWPRPSARSWRCMVAMFCFGRDARVRAGLHRVLLGGETERVVAHRVQHVEAVHALEARVHVGGDEAERMADVQPDAARVREHVEHEQAAADRRCGADPRSAGRCDSASRRRARSSQRSCHLCSISLASAAV